MATKFKFVSIEEVNLHKLFSKSLEEDYTVIGWPSGGGEEIERQAPVNLKSKEQRILGY